MGNTLCWVTHFLNDLKGLFLERKLAFSAHSTLHSAPRLSIKMYLNYSFSHDSDLTHPFTCAIKDSASSKGFKSL